MSDLDKIATDDMKHEFCDEQPCQECLSLRIRPGKTISTKELAVVANFANGFAEHVLELTDGTLIFISYTEDRVRIVERELK